MRSYQGRRQAVEPVDLCLENIEARKLRDMAASARAKINLKSLADRHGGEQIPQERSLDKS